MTIDCRYCGKRFDDARCWTICPHESLMSDKHLNQKDRAMKLLGKAVVFNHMPDEKPRRIESITWDGMVSVSGMEGYFAPWCFVVVRTAV